VTNSAGQEHAGRAGLIGGQGLADLDRQRDPLDSESLAPHGDLTGTSVHIRQGERGGFRAIATQHDRRLVMTIN